jgi:hypothetical protein
MSIETRVRFEDEKRASKREEKTRRRQAEIELEEAAEGHSVGSRSEDSSEPD